MAKYLQLITRTKDQKSEAANKRASEEAAEQLEVDILSTKRRKGDTESKIEEAKGQVPLNAGDIIALTRQAAAYADDLAALNALKEELF